MKKLIFPLLILLLSLVIGFTWFNNYIYQQKQNYQPKNISPYRGTLTGEYVCLPHRDTRGPQTLECASGIKTTAGEYYALDLNLLSGESPGLQFGDRFTASGNITPIEMLSSGHWQKYAIIGIFSVTDSVKRL